MALKKEKGLGRGHELFRLSKGKNKQKGWTIFACAIKNYTNQ